MKESFATSISSKFARSTRKSWRAICGGDPWAAPTSRSRAPLTLRAAGQAAREAREQRRPCQQHLGRRRPNATDSVLKAMQTELQRATADLGKSSSRLII